MKPVWLMTIGRVGGREGALDRRHGRVGHIDEHTDAFGLGDGLATQSGQPTRAAPRRRARQRRVHDMGQPEHPDAAASEALDPAEVSRHDLTTLDAGEAAHRRLGRVRGGHGIPPGQAPARPRDPVVDAVEERLGDGQVVVQDRSREPECPEVGCRERAAEVVETGGDREPDDIQAAQPRPGQVHVTMIQPGQEGSSEERRPDEQVDDRQALVPCGHVRGHRPRSGPDGAIEHPVDDAVDHPGERPRSARWPSRSRRRASRACRRAPISRRRVATISRR